MPIIAQTGGLESHNLQALDVRGEESSIKSSEVDPVHSPNPRVLLEGGPAMEPIRRPADPETSAAVGKVCRPNPSETAMHASARCAPFREPSRNRSSSLRDLVARTAAGDRCAETEIVDELGRGTFLLLRRLAGNKELAEDLYQETFRIVLSSLREGRLKNPDKLAAFVRGTAKNLLRSEWRKRERRGPHDDVADMALVDESPGPWDRASLAEDRAHVRRILEDLPSQRDREVLYSHYLAEEEKTETCTRLGIASGQFNLILFRARQRFRRLASGDWSISFA